MRSPPALLAFPAMAFVAAASLQEFYRGVRVRVRGHRDSLLWALPRLVWSNKPRYGGQIVHLGLIVVAMGVASYFMYSTSAGGILAPGESLSVGRYELTFNGLEMRSTETQDIAAANLVVTRDGEPDGTIAPEMVLYRSAAERDGQRWAAQRPARGPVRRSEQHRRGRPGHHPGLREPTGHLDLDRRRCDAGGHGHRLLARPSGAATCRPPDGDEAPRRWRRAVLRWGLVAMSPMGPGREPG